MKVKKIIHTDGSVSYTSQNISIVKNKEEKSEQIVVEFDDTSVLEAAKEGEQNG